MIIILWIYAVVTAIIFAVLMFAYKHGKAQIEVTSNELSDYELTELGAIALLSITWPVWIFSMKINGEKR